MLAATSSAPNCEAASSGHRRQLAGRNGPPHVGGRWMLHPSPKHPGSGDLPSTPGCVDARCKCGPGGGSALSPQCNVLGDIQTRSRAGADTVNFHTLSLV